MDGINATSEQFFEALLDGDRAQARRFLAQSLANVREPQDLVPSLFWPVYQRIESLFRLDQITKLQHHAATRLLRVMVDQASANFLRCDPNGQQVLAFCGPEDADELGAQMAVDMMEAAGFTIRFAGSGIAIDEILAQVQSTKPDLLVLFASAPGDLPHTRELIDTIHEIGACPNLRIVVGGGVYNRAEGLAEEIGADGMAEDPIELVELLCMGVPQADRSDRAPRRTVRKAA
ncbi:MAG: cobalamin B12-binding domain-containing protein [Phycisphaeraceae bacterium]|nr:cobalamin B12-binding domain-containing protein [Phycisphaerales bacterium]MCB9859034.1 cobalamin B12-binding domain-containing protein [Phycisphaeraceae bacterium]